MVLGTLNTRCVGDFLLFVSGRWSYRFYKEQINMHENGRMNVHPGCRVSNEIRFSVQHLPDILAAALLWGFLPAPGPCLHISFPVMRVAGPCPPLSSSQETAGVSLGGDRTCAQQETGTPKSRDEISSSGGRCFQRR